nr:alanine racemase [Mammaliicoccus sp. Marseille-Q6498]
MSEKYYRPTYINVDLQAILENYQSVGRLHPNKKIMAVVKANGYGLGSVPIASYLMNNGVDFFAVATLDEAIELRMHGIKAKILVLGIINTKDINKAVQHRVALTVPSEEWLTDAIQALDDEVDKPLWMHVKIDTGMGRIGLKDIQSYQSVVNTIEHHERLIFEGVYTHFASADVNDDYSERQYQLFEKFVEASNIPEYVHAQNSAGALRYDASICTAVRFGISLYGYYPSKYIQEISNLKLKPAAQLVTEIVQTKYIDAGEAVSYGATYAAEERIKVATLPIGYADGYLRKMQDTFVNVNGINCPVIGRVCMDQTMIKVPDHIETGQKVILMDNHIDSEQSAEKIAEALDTINYEVLCNLKKRLPRVYYDGENNEVTNELLK